MHSSEITQPVVLSFYYYSYHYVSKWNSTTLICNLRNHLLPDYRGKFQLLQTLCPWKQINLLRHHLARKRWLKLHCTTSVQKEGSLLLSLQPKQNHPEGEWQDVSAITYLDTDHLYLTFVEVHKDHKNTTALLDLISDPSNIVSHSTSHPRRTSTGHRGQGPPWCCLLELVFRDLLPQR